MGALTGLMVIAGAGMLNNTGLQVNSELTALKNEFNNENISGAVQRLLAVASQEVKDSLALAPSFMTGIPPAGVDLPAGFSSTNVIDSVHEQGSSLLSNGVKGFTNIFSQASGHTATSFGFAGALAETTGKKFDDLGFTFSNYDDVMTGGVSSQFEVDSLPVLAEEMSRMGTMFSTQDLATMTNPGAVCSNLIDQGLGDIGNLRNMLEEELLNMDDLASENPELIKNIMATITGSDLDEIIQLTGFTPSTNAQIETLADVLKINNVLSPDAQKALGPSPSMDDISRKFSNIGGRFKNLTALTGLYKSLELKSFPRLKDLGALVPADMNIDLSSSMGKGSGELGNPTMPDMVGSASGDGYLEEIKKVIALQKSLLENDPDVQAFVEYVATEPSPDPELLDSLIYDINSKIELQNDIYDGEAAMIHITERLSTEKSNLITAGIDLIKSAVPQGVMNMAGNLHGFGVDPMNLGLGNILNGCATDDVHGDALQASLIEGRNLGRLSVFGIKPGTKMDAMSYASSLRNISI